MVGPEDGPASDRWSRGSGADSKSALAKKYVTLQDIRYITSSSRYSPSRRYLATTWELRSIQISVYVFVYLCPIYI